MATLTAMIRTARSRRLSIQNAQLPSHLYPFSNIIGSTFWRSRSVNTGPSSRPSRMRANAIASWMSSRLRTHTLTASRRLSPNMKKVAANSNDSASSPSAFPQFSGIRVKKIALTEPPLAEKRKCVLLRGRLPPFLSKVVGEELQHFLLLRVPCRLLPQTKHKPRLAQRKVKQRACYRVTVLARHVLISGHRFSLRSLAG